MSRGIVAAFIAIVLGIAVCEKQPSPTISIEPTSFNVQDSVKPTQNYIRNTVEPIPLVVPTNTPSQYTQAQPSACGNEQDEYMNMLFGIYEIVTSGDEYTKEAIDPVSQRQVLHCVRLYETDYSISVIHHQIPELGYNSLYVFTVSDLMVIDDLITQKSYFLDSDHQVFIDRIDLINKALEIFHELSDYQQ